MVSALIMELRDRCENASNSSIYQVESHMVFNATCVQEFVDWMYDNEIFQPQLLSWEAVLFSAVYIVIAILGLFGNGLVVFVVIRKSEMRTNRNVFITNLAISNFILAALLYPCLWMPAKEYHFPLGTFFCKFANAAPSSNVYCSTLTISIMAIDRYYLIRRARVVDSAGHKIAAVILAISIWLVSLALNLPLLINYELRSFPFSFDNLPIGDNKTASFGWPICTFSATSFVSGMVGIFPATFLYVIPVIVLAFFNLKLTQFIQRRAHNSLLTIPDPSHTHSASRESCYTGGSAVQASQQRRSRTTSLMIAMAMSYGILWLPFTIVSILSDFEMVKYNVHIDYTAKLISMLSICVNPFLYGWLNTNFNREFREIFAQLPCHRWYQKRHPQTRHPGNIRNRATKNVCLTVINSEAMSTSCRVNTTKNFYGSLEHLSMDKKSQVVGPESRGTPPEPPAETCLEVVQSKQDECSCSHQINKDGVIFEEMAPSVTMNGVKNKVSIVVNNTIENSINACEVVLCDDEQHDVLFL